ncbi:VIT domain-containing protein [soil metagenome]
MKYRFCALLGLLCWMVCATSRADGLIVISEPPAPVPGHFAFAPLEVSYHRVSVTIDDAVAVTSVDQEFYNPNPQRLEGTYLFPIPEGATIDKFAMDIDGKMMDAELLPADKARSIYEDIVRRQKDPALLEYAGRAAFKVRIFPIEPNSRKHVKLQYTQLIKTDSGLSEYSYPLNTEKFSSKPLGDVSVKVELKTARPIKNVYCPSHTVEIRRDGNQHVVAGYEDRNVRPDTDFKLVWSQDKDPIGMNLLSWQTGSDDGYFLMLASPGTDVDAKAVQPKDICFVIDTSGSMAGAKLEQAKKALLFCLANLNANDRFEIVRFSTESESLFGALVAPDAANLDKARAFVTAMKPIGGTAIKDALDVATALPLKQSAPADETKPASRPYTIIFLTDGQPTVGETREDAIVEASTGHAPASGTRIFCFGIGNDVNTHLLDRIADASHAFSQYVLPAEDIEVKVSNFYTKIKEPVLSKLAVNFTGDVTVSQQYPHDLPDLFKGDTITIFGRYHGSRPGAAKLTGQLNGEQRSFVSDVKFSKEDVKYGFIPRLWATRRVGWLLDEIRMHGESKELKDEIARLAREHGIVTPYTSYLIIEDEQRRNVPVAMQTMREMKADDAARDRAGAFYDSARADSAKLEKSGEQAVANATAAGSLRQSTNESESAQSYGLAKGGGGDRFGRPMASAAPQSHGYKVAQNYAQQARVVKGRAFYQNGSVWTDGNAQTAQNLKQQAIKFNSDEYFALLMKHPEAAAWLSLGDQLDVVLDDTLYSIR